MCVDAADRGPELIRKAADAAETILRRCYGVRVAKSADISTREGFDEAVAALADRLRGRARSEEAAAVRAALAVLDIDWRRTDVDLRARLVNEAMEAAGQHLALVPREIKTTLDTGAADTINATRDSLRRRGVTIGASWNAVDRRIAEHLTKSTGNFVTDEYRRRNDAFGDEADRIIAAGVERGAGRDEIARELEAAAQGKIAGRSASYWDVIAGAFVGRGRSFAQVSGYAEAGIERYRIVAMLDERTTPVCRFLDGKTFAVADGLRAFEEQEAIEEPEQIKRVAPWARLRAAPDGKPTIVVNHATGQRAIAVVERSGVGARDDRGEFSRGRSERELNALGLSFPPYHGLCRTTTVPE